MTRTSPMHPSHPATMQLKTNGRHLHESNMFVNANIVDNVPAQYFATALEVLPITSISAPLEDGVRVVLGRVKGKTIRSA